MATSIGLKVHTQPGSPVVNLGVCEGLRPSIPALYPNFPKESRNRTNLRSGHGLEWVCKHFKVLREAYAISTACWSPLWPPNVSSTPRFSANGTAERGLSKSTGCLQCQRADAFIGVLQRKPCPVKACQAQLQLYPPSKRTPVSHYEFRL